MIFVKHKCYDVVQHINCSDLEIGGVEHLVPDFFYLNDDPSHQW